MREIELTKGKVALVDDEDFEWLSNWKWFAVEKKHGFYAAGFVNPETRKWTYMHRALLDAPRGSEVDHINHNGLDNQRSNLRLCTHGQNACNGRPRKNKTSKYRGVYRHSNGRCWTSQITINNTVVYLGIYADELEAARAYDLAASEHFGEFATLNDLEVDCCVN